MPQATCSKRRWPRRLAWGSKPALDQLVLWQAVRHGALGRWQTFDSLPEHFLPGRHDPPDFALRLAREDVSLAVEVGREFDVPMRLANMPMAELTEALNRGWGKRDSRVAMFLQEERAGIDVHVPQEEIQEILDSDRTGA